MYVAVLDLCLDNPKLFSGEGVAGLYEPVPTIMPSVVSLYRSNPTAKPKSPILAMPSDVIQTLPGFRSR